MEKKSTISKKTLKIILGICIAAAILAVAGLFGYTYMADHNTGPENFRVGSGGFQAGRKAGRRKNCCGI